MSAQQMSAKNAAITREIIREQTKVFGQKMKITDFEYNSGCLNKFKKQRGFSHSIRNGETADVDEDVVVNGRKKLSALILGYKADNVCNMDESGLFFTISCQIK